MIVVASEGAVGLLLASHFHDMIVRQALSSPLVIAAGIALLVAGFRRWRGDAGRWLGSAVLALGLSVTLVGGFRLVEVPALSHNHLCHNHHADISGCDYQQNRPHDDTHEHWFGGKAAAR